MPICKERTLRRLRRLRSEGFTAFGGVFGMKTTQLRRGLALRTDLRIRSRAGACSEDRAMSLRVDNLSAEQGGMLRHTRLVWMVAAAQSGQASALDHHVMTTSK